MMITNWLILSVLISAIQEEPKVLAEVDGYRITSNRVDRYLAQKLGDTQLNSRARKVAQFEATNHLIDRHLVFTKINSSGIKIGDGQVAIEVSKLKDRLAEINKTLPQYLKEGGISQEELEYEFRWRLAWKKYLAKQLTDDRLDSYYKKFRRKFDGTSMHVAHILFEKSNDAFEKAENVKYELETGAISWSEATKKHSIATTSALKGGEIGWIDYHGPMVPEFCQEAMNLERGQLSSPVATKFGIHLIKCLEIKPGKIGPSDARSKVREDAMKFLFDSLAGKAKKSADIKIDIQSE